LACLLLRISFKVLFKTTVMPTVKVFNPQTDTQLNCLKNNFKFYIKIDIKTAPTCFDAITVIRERLFGLAKVTVVKITS
jgi:hypothetical protein